MLKWVTVFSAYVNSFYCAIQSVNSTGESKALFCTDMCGGQTTQQVALQFFHAALIFHH